MEKPNYYAVIPANVRYDKELTPMAKLLYGEISALAQKEGTCWATNGYFAELYGVNNLTISRLISQLEKKGYITVEIVYKEGSKEIDKRVIGIDKKINTPIQKNQEGTDEKINTPIDEKIKENNTSNKQYKNNNKEKEIKKKKFTPPTLEEVEAYVKENGLTVNAKDFIDYFEATNWIDSKGQKVISWKGKIRTWQRFQPHTRDKPKRGATFAELLEKEYGDDQERNDADNEYNADILSEVLPEYDIR